MNSYSEIKMDTDLTLSVLFVVNIKGYVNKLDCKFCPSEETSQIRQMSSWTGCETFSHPQEKKIHHLYSVKYMFTCSVDKNGCAILS